MRSIKTTGLFRAVNYELYAKPVSKSMAILIQDMKCVSYDELRMPTFVHNSQNAVIMGIGLVCLIGATGYIAYMRSKYEDMGYYSAVQADGTEVFTKKKSKWD